MPHTLKLRRFGTSVGVVLRKEVLAKLKAEAGDTVFLDRHAGGYRILSQNSKAMDIYRRVAAKYRNALRELAK